MKERGFTLIELLVVIAIIALLMAIVMPGLNMAKKKASSIACLSNVRQMSLAWHMYANESDGEIMSAVMGTTEDSGRRMVGWIGMPRNADGTLLTSSDFGRTSPPVTDAHEIRGIEKGVLYSYLEAPDAYHCPGDKLRKGPDGTRLYGSYSIARCLYGWSYSNNQQIKKVSEITSPGRRYTFVENGESNRGNWIMLGTFVIAAPEYNASGYGLWSPVAISHGNSSTFGFADGHAEIKRWHATAIFDHYYATENLPPNTMYGFRDVGSQDEDILWLAKGWAYRHK